MDRVRRLFEVGEYDEETFMLKCAEIKREQERLREQTAALRSRDDTEWCRLHLFDLLAGWDAAAGGQRTKLLGALFERIEAHAAVPETFARRFRTKRDADSFARRLTENSYEVEWVRRDYGANGYLSWNIRLADGSEIHNSQQLEDLGLGVAHGEHPFRGGVKVVAVPREA